MTKKTTKKKVKVNHKKVKSVKKVRVSKASKSAKAKSGAKSKRIQGEFNKFAQGVEELETLRHELNALNSRGFEDEEKIIRAKLHDIDNIPAIKREISGLRKKIEIKRKGRKKKVEMQRKILQESKQMEQKISQLEGEIEKKKVKKQLSSEDLGNVKDIPKLENSLRALKQEFEEHNKKNKFNIDPSIGLLVNAKFGEFLNEIKGELSERIKKKEVQVEAGMKSDLEAREHVFAEKYNDLVEEFHKRFERRVHDELKREIKKNFNNELNAKMDKEKKKIISELVRQNTQELGAEKKELEAIEGNKLANRIQEIKNRMHEQVRVKVDEGVRTKVNLLRSEMNRNYEEKLNAEIRKKKAELDKRKTELEQHINDKARMLKNQMAKEKAELVGKVAKEKAELVGNVAKEKAELEKRKAELEEQVVSQARKMFK